MPPDRLFEFANLLALAGWLALIAGPLAPRLADRVAGFAIPALLSVGYTAIVLAYWAGAEGGFDSLTNVMTLFTNPWIALAGWVHFLAFDLFVGAWAARRAREQGIPHLLMLPVLALTFLFGPAGLFAYFILALAWPRASLGSSKA